ncbi:hypothetical protein SISNIDRAFT_240784 [Sistotremastrum niveocremeum HHB9708]|uniref:Uncharacterized protein n=1 Tax=Sistotremastrum niveocremeum HHB9708 TaxID=1314777 RepID=A0A164PPM7_9AGAM|nr:hypothetical protein SISNIDRAFT_240784 [Sistotremastrum niveocremeum HHB9708]
MITQYIFLCIYTLYSRFHPTISAVVYSTLCVGTIFIVLDTVFMLFFSCQPPDSKEGTPQRLGHSG